MIENVLARLEDYKYTHLVERNKERLEHCTENDRAKHCEGIDCFWCVWNKAIEIVQEVVKEYGKDTNVPSNGWIPCEVAVPKENGWYWGYHVTSSYIGTDGIRHTECRYESIYWEDNLWLYNPMGFRTVDEVIAWKPIAPYQKGE